MLNKVVKFGGSSLASAEQFEKVATAGMSDAQIYKQAGNSITVNVVEAIARNLLKFDEEENANGTGN